MENKRTNVKDWHWYNFEFYFSFHFSDILFKNLNVVEYQFQREKISLYSM
jgi:hypothetical protein